MMRYHLTYEQEAVLAEFLEIGQGCKQRTKELRDRSFSLEHHFI
jgi:hypothetical protein